MVEMMRKRSISSEIICNTAKEMGYDVKIINENKNLFIVKDKDKEILFKSTDCGVNTSLGLKVCNDKGLTYDILGGHGIRIAKSIYLNKNDLKTFDINNIGIDFPLVVKPIDGGHGDGVYTEIKDGKELQSCIKKSFEFSDNIVIQEHIFGDEHRILVIGDEVIYGIKRIPAYVIGDGKSTIRELIEKENQNPLRGEGYDKPMTNIVIDRNLIDHVNKNYNYNIDDVPKSLEKVVLRGVSNIGAGGFIEDVTHKLGELFKKECIDITKSLGLQIAGLDIITTDVSKTLGNSKGIVVEIGATPGFGGDLETTGINPAEHLLNFVFNNG